MTYELAKQLKEAGYPRGDQLNTPQPQFFEDETYKIPVRTPTLEELLVVCGEGVGTFIISNKEATAWKKNWPTNDPDDVPLIYTGSTPTEAVANLWLALHANDTKK